MGIGMLVRQLWKKKAKAIIIGGALLSATSLASAIGYSTDKEYGKAVGSGASCMALAFGTGWYCNSRYRRRKEEKEKYRKKEEPYSR